MFLPERHDRFRLAWEKEGFDEEKVLDSFMRGLYAVCCSRMWHYGC